MPHCPQSETMPLPGKNAPGTGEAVPRARSWPGSYPVGVTRLLLTAVFAVAVLGQPLVYGQRPETQAVPFTVWIDLRALTAPDAAHPSWPGWLEQLEIHSPRDRAGEILKTTLRLRLQKANAPSAELGFRLFFEDRRGVSPVVTAWSELGRQSFQSVPLGQSLGLPTSESMTIPMTNVDYVEMEVPGDGSNVRGIFLHWVKRVQTTQAVDFQPLDLVDPFGAPAPARRNDNDAHLFSSLAPGFAVPKMQLTFGEQESRPVEFALQSALFSPLRPREEPPKLDFQLPPELAVAPWMPVMETSGSPPPPLASDAYLFGRVKALLEAGPVRLTAGGSSTATFEFELEAQPHVAVITFEMLNADIASPPEVSANSRSLGPASVSFPDLADPGYEQLPSPEPWEMRFHYTGWLKCQKVIPRSALRAGTNRVVIEVGDQSGGVAVRSIEVQLKYAPVEPDP